MFVIDEVTLPKLGNTGLECRLSEEERAIQESAQRLAKDVLRPIAVGGRCKSTRGSFAARMNKASAAIPIPGEIAPPR